MQTQNPICQSCGMPMIKLEEFGSNTDGSKNEEYCTYCFQKGDFTMKGTLKDMIDMLVSMADKMGMTAEAARKMADENLPKLKRWT
jgi:hypothetical protein